MDILSTTELSEGTNEKLIIDIKFGDDRWRIYDQLPELLETVIVQCLSSAKIAYSSDSEVSFLLVNDISIQQLNKIWRGKDSPTNVLSFTSISTPMAESPHMFGDIILSLDTISKQAINTGIKIQDHVAHLAAHGFLHLVGYSHNDDKSASIMESLEIEILSKIGIANPYVST